MSEIKKDTIAFDYSQQSIDHDGRLRVELTPISKSNLCPYYGWEIPSSQQMGLDQEKVYTLFRDPMELQLAADTANSIPLLEIHKAVTPSEPAQEIVVGALGTDAVFQSPYLMNSLVVWEQSAIDLIVTGKKKQLSCAYRYDADMTPGAFEGVAYDGVMRNIKFNHCALVIEGRAGPDVMVSDSMPLELINKDVKMTKTKMALDAEKEAEDAFEDKDAEDSKECSEDEDLDGMDEAEKDKAAKDKKAKDKAAKDKKAKDKKASDADPDDDDDDDDDKKANDAQPSVSQQAMDAAMATVARDTEKRIRMSMRALRDAEDLVRPVVGNLIACDSAEEVYEVLFKHQNVDYKDMPVAGYPTFAKLIVGNSGLKKQQRTVAAMDSSTIKTFASRFPNASKIKAI